MMQGFGRFPANTAPRSIHVSDGRQHEDSPSAALQGSHPVHQSNSDHEHGYVNNRMNFARGSSLARTLSKPVVLGSYADSDDVDQRHHHKGKSKGFEDQDTLKDMYIEDLIELGEVPTDKTKEKEKMVNVRASMGVFALMLHDFKHWYHRWKNQHWEVPFLNRQIKYMESHFGSGIGSVFVFTRWVLCLNMVMAFLWLVLVVIPMASDFTYSQVNHHFALKNLFDGQGVLTEVWMFYGRYTWEVGNGYNLAVSYLVLILITYFGSMYVLLRSIGLAHSTKLSSSKVDRLKFSMLLFTSWDYSISSEEASVYISKGIASVFKDNLHEVKATEAVKSRSKRERYILFAKRALCWFITILLVGGGCAAIVCLVIYVNFSNVTESVEGQADFISVYGTPIMFSLINLIVPKCINLLPKLEKYDSGQFELNITLARVFILRMANLFALLVSLYGNVTTLKTGCVGTFIGQEFYKLVVMDTIVHACFQLSIKFSKFFWTREKGEFNISSAVLALVYRQGLVWVGTIACPVLPFIGALSNLTFFFVNYLIVKKTCAPPMKRWNQSRNTSFLNGFLIITLFVIIIPISIIIGSHDIISLGQTGRKGVFCGPFGGLRPTDVYRKFARSQSDWLETALSWLTSDCVVIPVFLILVSLLSYQKSLHYGEKQHRIILQTELQQERKDNQLLLKRLQRYDATGLGQQQL